MGQPGQLDCSGEHGRYGAGDFVVELRFAPLQSNANDPLVLRTTSVWQHSARIHFRYADGTEASLSQEAQDAAAFLAWAAEPKLMVRKESGFKAVLLLGLLSVLLYLTNKRLWSGIKGKKLS